MHMQYGEVAMLLSSMMPTRHIENAGMEAEVLSFCSLIAAHDKDWIRCR